MRTLAVAAAVALLAVAAGPAQAAIPVSEISYLPPSGAVTIKEAINQKNLTTYSVTSSFTNEFKSVATCLPLALTFNTANNESVTSYKFSVNTTSLEQSYNLHPFVTEKGVFTLALNGTLTSSDLVNVTVTVPDDKAAQITNVTATGQSWVAFNFQNVTDTTAFQAQIAATGVLTLNHTLDSLLVYASTNGSAVLDGKLNNVYINYASTQPIILTRAQQLTLLKTGKGSLFIGNVSEQADVTMAGTGAVSFNSTANLNLVQQGAGSVLAGVLGVTNVTYAGGKNSTFFNGLPGRTPATVNYLNSGNGTLVFTGNLEVNGDAPPAGSCLNITNFSEKDCITENIIPVPTYPLFPPRRPRCRNGEFVLKNSEQCFATPKEGYQCRTSPPVNGGKKFALVLGIIVVTVLMIWVNSI